MGTVRLRIQIVPDPPFIRASFPRRGMPSSTQTQVSLLGNVTFTLMGVPKVRICRVLSQSTC